MNDLAGPVSAVRKALEGDDEAITAWARDRWPVVKSTPGDGVPGSSSKTAPTPGYVSPSPDAAVFLYDQRVNVLSKALSASSAPQQ